MKTLIRILAALILTHSLCAVAGGMSGGGGEIIDDLHNPWFLPNTQTITYCIKLDSASVSTDLNTVTQLVAQGIKDWTQEFANYNSRHSNTALKVATQNWIALDCLSPVDVTFQFGWGTLNRSQIKDLSGNGDPHRYIAVAWRSSYDEVQLKGKGYIYIASDQGENAFTQDPDQLVRPWQYSTLLYVEIMHELGHIFGLPHLSTKVIDISSRWLMSEYFPEVVLGQWLWKNNPDGLTHMGPDTGTDWGFFDHPSYVAPVTNQPNAQAITSWFGSPQGTALLQFNLQIQDDQVASLQVQSMDAQGKPLGKPVPVTIDSSNSQVTSDILAYLNPKQTVLPPPVISYIPYVAGPGASSGQILGHYPSPSGKSLSLMVTFDNESLRVIVSDPVTGNIIPLVDTQLAEFGRQR